MSSGGNIFNGQALNSAYGGPGQYNVNTTNVCGGGGGGLASQSVQITSQGTAGFQSSITGVATWYAGGGGAGSYNSGPGTGGLGGAGSTTGSQQDTGTPTTPNTGGGSGGYSAGGGASGVVIIAYPTEFDELRSIDGTLSYTMSMNGSRSGYYVYTFTGGAGSITF